MNLCWPFWGLCLHLSRSYWIHSNLSWVRCAGLIQRYSTWLKLLQVRNFCHWIEVTLPSKKPSHYHLTNKVNKYLCLFSLAYPEPWVVSNFSSFLISSSSLVRLAIVTRAMHNNIFEAADTLYNCIEVNSTDNVIRTSATRNLKFRWLLNWSLMQYLYFVLLFKDCWKTVQLTFV